VSRRIFLYWLLLLLPTLAAGLGAVVLLRREQARITQRAAYADEARRAAATARAQLVVENVELLVGDVQNALLDTVASASARGLDAFLEQWERSNPLVRTAFRCTADGRMLRPAAATPDENARGFMRRFGLAFDEVPPWSVGIGKLTVRPEPAAKKEQEADRTPERQQVAANVAQVQSARRDVQELAKAKVFSSAPLATDSMATGIPAPRESKRAGVAPAESSRAAAAEQDSAMLAMAKDQAGPADPPALDRDRTAGTTPGRRGWTPWKDGNRLHLFGWVQANGAGEVRGVELDMAALVARLGGALPAGPGGDEGFALRDDQGRVLHQAGAVPRAGVPLVRVPVSAALLPGWEVVAFLATTPETGDGSAGFVFVGSLLAGILVVAILAGGSLLLWQARTSEAEARQKTSFVSNVSHEFKTPLTTIRLYAELLEQGRVRDAAQGNEYLRTIGRETQRLARLVNNVLDFSRLEQGRKKYEREPLDLAAELARLLDTQAVRLAEAEIELRRELPAVPLTVTTDRDAVEQIVLNLLDNAGKYAADGREVTVALVGRVGGGAELRVLDRGPGVPAAHRERIFEKFHRVDETLTAEKPGAGLGLSIARQLARGLGGDLRCEPRAGGGAAFVLTLP
jgi:signal transduction histidine kinase